MLQRIMNWRQMNAVNDLLKSRRENTRVWRETKRILTVHNIQIEILPVGPIMLNELCMKPNASSSSCALLILPYRLSYDGGAEKENLDMKINFTDSAKS